MIKIKKFNEFLNEKINNLDVELKTTLETYFMMDFDKFMDRILYEYGYSSKDVEYIGGGWYGWAFKIEDKVIKITTDKFEYINALHLRKKPLTKHLINYYDARKLDLPLNPSIFSRKRNFTGIESDYGDVVYVILMDYVKSIKSDSEVYDDLDFILADLYNNDINSAYLYVDKKKFIGKLTFTKRQIDKMYRDIIELKKEAKKYNIDLTDFGVNNIGFDEDENLVYFDIGGFYIKRKENNKLKSITI